MSLTVETHETLTQAAQAMGPDARFLAGGTLVMRAVNYGDTSFSRIVRTTDRALTDIRAERDRMVIGAGVTMAGVIASRELDFLAPVARAVGGPAVRSAATVGGNLFAAYPYGDFAAALLALDGTATMADGRTIPLEALLAGREGMRDLVASVSVLRPQGDDFRFRKVSRVKPKGISVMSIAAHLPRSGGRVAAPCVAFGAMGETPMRATAAEGALNGASLDEGGIARALAVATDGLDPRDDALASAWYRREVAPVHLRRLLLKEGAA